MRDWLFVIVGILILGILFDGLRRMRNNHRNSLRMKRLKDDDVKADPDELTSSEFPSGGARVVTVRDPNESEGLNQNVRQSYVASRQTRGAPRREPEQSSLDLESSAPILMESVAGEEADEQDVVQQGPETKIASEPDDGGKVVSDRKAFDEEATDEQDADEHTADGHNIVSQKKESSGFEQFFGASQHREPSIGDLSALDDDDDLAGHAKESVKDTAEEVEMAEAVALADSEGDEPIGKVRRVERKVEPTTNTKKSTPFKSHKPAAKASAAQTSPKSEPPKKAESNPLPDEVLVIHIMAKRGQQFDGATLLEALLAEGLRYGDMDIFHRHETDDGDGPILFSLANTVMPGTFNLNDMETFSTPGVSLFLGLPIKGDSIAAYDLMALTAHNLAQALGGELKDENRSVMTRQTIEHGRQRVIEYERKRRLAKA